MNAYRVWHRKQQLLHVPMLHVHKQNIWINKTNRTGLVSYATTRNLWPGTFPFSLARPAVHLPRAINLIITNIKKSQYYVPIVCLQCMELSNREFKDTMKSKRLILHIGITNLVRLSIAFALSQLLPNIMPIKHENSTLSFFF